MVVKLLLIGTGECLLEEFHFAIQFLNLEQPAIPIQIGAGSVVCQFIVFHVTRGIPLFWRRKNKTFPCCLHSKTYHKSHNLIYYQQRMAIKYKRSQVWKSDIKISKSCHQIYDPDKINHYSKPESGWVRLHAQLQALSPRQTNVIKQDIVSSLQRNDWNCSVLYSYWSHLLKGETIKQIPSDDLQTQEGSCWESYPCNSTGPRL